MRYKPKRKSELKYKTVEEVNREFEKGGWLGGMGEAERDVYIEEIEEYNKDLERLRNAR